MPWKIRIQTTRKLLGLGTKSEKWQKLHGRMVELFFFLFEIDIYYFLYIHGIFKSHLKKITAANSHPKSQFDLSPYYINLLKNDSVPPLPPPSPRGNSNYEILLDISMYIFNCNKTVEAIQRFIQALLMSIRWNKKLNLLIEF